MSKFGLSRVRLNQGGYDSRGSYWGIGQPLYHYATELPDSYAHSLGHTTCQFDLSTIGHLDNIQTCPDCGYAIRKVYNDVSDHVRADNREHAKARIQALYPGATFYR